MRERARGRERNLIKLAEFLHSVMPKAKHTSVFFWDSINFLFIYIYVNWVMVTCE